MVMLMLIMKLNKAIIDSEFNVCKHSWLDSLN